MYTFFGLVTGQVRKDESKRSVPRRRLRIGLSSVSQRAIKAVSQALDALFLSCGHLPAK